MADAWESWSGPASSAGPAAWRTPGRMWCSGTGRRTRRSCWWGEGPGQREDEQGVPSWAPPVSCWTTCWRSSAWTGRRVRGQYRQVPPAPEPGPPECGSRTPASAGCGSRRPCCGPRSSSAWADRRQGHHQGGLQDHRRAREVVPAGRRPDDRHLPSLGPAAGCGQAAGDLHGPEGHPGQGPGDLRPYLMLKRRGGSSAAFFWTNCNHILNIG